jgi:hypothetical protein
VLPTDGVKAGRVGARADETRGLPWWVLGDEAGQGAEEGTGGASAEALGLSETPIPYARLGIFH